MCMYVQNNYNDILMKSVDNIKHNLDSQSARFLFSSSNALLRCST